MKSVFRSDYFQATLFPETEFLHLVRTANILPTPLEVDRAYAAVADELVRWRGNRFLFDLRLGPATNDPELEERMQPHISRVLGVMARWAFLVRTAVGGLQVRRLAREQGTILRQVFSDEQAARAYLLGPSEPGRKPDGG